MVNEIEKLRAAVNMQLTIGMNQLLIQLYHNVTLLVTSHGSIQHPVLFCIVNWCFWIIYFLNCSVYDTNTNNKTIFHCSLDIILKVAVHTVWFFKFAKSIEKKIAKDGSAWNTDKICVLKQLLCQYARLIFFGYLFYNAFGKGSSSVTCNFFYDIRGTTEKSFQLCEDTGNL